MAASSHRHAGMCQSSGVTISGLLQLPGPAMVRAPGTMAARNGSRQPHCRMASEPSWSSQCDMGVSQN